MAITTDSLYNVTSNDVTYDVIGLSKTLNNYTAAELWDYVFCSSTSNQLYHIGYGGASMSYYTYQGDDNYVPLELIYQSTNHNQMRFHPDQVMNNPDGLYMRVIWLQRTKNGSDKYITRGNTDYKLITMFNAPHYVYECNTPRMVDNSHGATSWNAGSYLYYSDGGSLYYYDNVSSETPTRINIPRVVPAIIFKDRNDNVYILPYRQSMAEFITKQNTEVSGWSPSCANQFYDWTGEHCIAFPVVCSVLYSNLNASTGALTSPFSDGDRLPEGSGIYARGCYGVSPITHLITTYECGGSASTAYGLGFRTVNYFRDVENCKKFFSLAGLYFKADKIYKPIISGGYVNGFTDNLATPSDIDNWDGKTQHAVPVNPPGPPTPSGDNENEEIEMPLAYIGGTGGFVQFIKINSAGLASADDISAALSRFDITTIGKDLLRNFISYKCFAVLSIDPDDTVTRQIKVDGHALTDENDQPLNGQVIGSVLPIDFEIGTPSRYFNDFRDFAPYTKIEAYVPFCGWFALPSWCIGHKITGTMFTDLYNGTVKAVIFAGSTVVAEVGGCCAYDIPFVADATGAKAGAVISSALSTAAATVATVSMPNVATGIAAVTSAANTISAVNSNDTTLKGVLGDGSNLNGLLHCYLKVTRPQSPTRNNEIPNAYKHEVGIPTYKAITLASGDGYTQIMDAKIEGTMTDKEKQMIVDGFRHGLIL